MVYIKNIDGNSKGGGCNNTKPKEKPNIKPVGINKKKHNGSCLKSNDYDIERAPMECVDCGEDREAILVVVDRNNKEQWLCAGCITKTIKELESRVKDLEDAFKDPSNRIANTQAQMCKFLDGLLKGSNCYCELGDHFASRELMKESDCECESLGFETVDELGLIHISFDGKWEKEALENLAKQDAKKKYEVTIDMFGETKHVALQDFINGLKKSHFTI